MAWRAPNVALAEPSKTRPSSQGGTVTGKPRSAERDAGRGSSTGRCSRRESTRQAIVFRLCSIRAWKTAKDDYQRSSARRLLSCLISNMCAGRQSPHPTTSRSWRDADSAAAFPASWRLRGQRCSSKVQQLRRHASTPSRPLTRDRSSWPRWSLSSTSDGCWSVEVVRLTGTPNKLTASGSASATTASTWLTSAACSSWRATYRSELEDALRVLEASLIRVWAFVASAL
jgi:hypothetical protein